MVRAASLLAVALLCGAAVAAASAGGLDMGDEFHFPQELTDDVAVQSLMDADDSDHDHVLPFHFRVNVEDDFDEVAFIAERTTVRRADPVAAAVAAEPAEPANEEEPILCETVCRPMNQTDRSVAGDDVGTYAAAAGNPEAVPTAAAQVGSMAQEEAREQLKEAGLTSMFLEMKRDICRSHGGKWNDARSGCDPFMKVTTAQTQYAPSDMFELCQQEHGREYAPCNPYQALALAHLYEVPDHAYYWLWPGGRHDQVRSAAFKQDSGFNPKNGMDKCPDHQHVGFFHNWDEAHVDSWGCLHDENNLRVLCCRRA